MKRYYILLSMSLFLASCGFHLRGSQVESAPRAVTGIALIDAAAVDVGREVRTQLESAGGSVLPSAVNAPYTLLLSDQSLDRSVLSVSAETGKVEEYQLTLTVRMSLVDRQENEIISGQAIQVTRDYPFDEQSVLGSVAERRVLEQEMVRQAAAQILRRLDAVIRD